MRLAIRHETLYRYTSPLTYTIQQLRLTPRIEAHQHTISWQLDTPGQRHPFTDAFGNLCHMLTITGHHDGVHIVVNGEVEVAPLIEQILAFAAQHLRRNRAADLLQLAQAICSAVSYQSGSTVVTTTADDALQLGQGVCQDHAHLFIACCHTRNIPARYVSGYIDSGSTGYAESHAWVDVWVEDSTFTGWLSIDVTHAKFANDAHCRLAIARDYDSAAPVRGVRHGGGEESLDVRVNVTPLLSQ